MRIKFIVRGAAISIVGLAAVVASELTAAAGRYGRY